MSFTLTFGQEGPCATAQVVWSVNNETYNFRSDNNFIGWISTIFTVADYLSSSGGNTNPLVLPDNTNANGWSLNTLDSGGVGGSITMIGSNGSNSGTINLSAGNYINDIPGTGGSINLVGGAGDGAPAGSSGSINLSGGNDGCAGGSLISQAGLGTGALGGTLNMSGGTDSNGGSITTIGGTGDNDGGSINTSGGVDGSGGSINLSNRGGSITMIGSGGEDGLYPSTAGSINLSAGLGGDGGSINLQGSQEGDESNKSAGGSINLSAGVADSAPGGSIISMGGSSSGSAGGTLNMTGGGGNPGGSITMLGSGDGAGGSIITSGGSGAGPGGDINTSNNGGDITTTGNGNYSGGDINTSASGDGSGGFINTSADSASGGYIDTSNGGGNIDTTGTGSIGFGTSGIRTTLVGSATEDRTITMPDSSGTMAVILVGSDTIDFPNIPANSTATHDVTISGVIPGEAVLVTCTDVRTGNDQRVIFTGFVASTPDTVTVLATNTSGAGINLPSLNFKIIVFRGL